MTTTITTLGVGAAFAFAKDPRRAPLQTNFLLRCDKRKSGLLVDCGQTAGQALAEVDMTLAMVEAAIITHGHRDHNGGLECFGLSTHFNPFYVGMGGPKHIDGAEKAQGTKPLLVCSERIHDNLVAEHPRTDMGFTGGLVLDKAEDFFSFNVFGNEGGSWEWADTGIKLEFVPIVHARPKDRATQEVRPLISFAVKITLPDGTKVVTVTDTCDVNLELLEWADLAFVDVEHGPIVTRVHTRFEEYAKLPEQVKRKLILVGYGNEGKNFQTGETIYRPDALEAGFAGYADKGQVFDLSDPSTWRGTARGFASTYGE